LDGPLAERCLYAGYDLRGLMKQLGLYRARTSA
jgi:hypothetical protein